MALCKIHHAAFDRSLLGINPSLMVRINQRLLDEIDGLMLKHGLQEMRGTTIAVPRSHSAKPDPERLEHRYARLVRRHGHFSPHIVFVLEGEITVGDRPCPAGTHIELPLGAAFGPIVAGPEGAVLFEVMMGDPRSWGDDREAFGAALAAQGAELLPDPPLEFPGLAGRPALPLGRRTSPGGRVSRAAEN